MLPLSYLARLVATVDGSGRSPVADAVVARWGYPAGAARHHRSSANHVFRVGTGYLRFVPAGFRSRAAVEAVAALPGRLPAVAPLVPSLAGRLVETVDTASYGPVHATVVAAAPGEQIEVSALTPARARAWGTGLARLHRDGPADGPDWFSELDRADVLEPESARVAALLAELPRDRSSYGFGHGDFELDNLRWSGETLTAYDLDESGRSWFAADIASAVRDLPSGPLFDAFVAGYRELRELPDADLRRLPLFAAAHAAVWLIRLPAVLDSVESDADEPGWVSDLRLRLLAYATDRRAMLRHLPGKMRQVADVSTPPTRSPGATTVN